MQSTIFVVAFLALFGLAETIELNGKRKLKILVNSPILGFSHVQFEGKVADALAEAGHEVVGHVTYKTK